MTVIRKEIIVPAKAAEKKIDESMVECDLCKKCMGKDDWSSIDWSTGYYDKFSTSVEISDGKDFPEGPSYTTTKYHICPACFRNKLQPWLSQQGASPTEKDID